jgi:secondary thiamine-phosphate synthase enzyme
VTAARQARVRLAPRPRGLHLVTRELLDTIDLAGLEAGMLQCFVRHTSAALTLNENASPEVRTDMAVWLDRAVPDGFAGFAHTLEGPDDMPAHVKASLIGPSILVPVADGRPLLGTWQGIWLCEFRDHAGPRDVVVTAWGTEAGGR